jgi:hypothetical protein
LHIRILPPDISFIPEDHLFFLSLSRFVKMFRPHIASCSQKILLKTARFPFSEFIQPGTSPHKTHTGMSKGPATKTEIHGMELPDVHDKPEKAEAGESRSPAHLVKK